MAARTTPIDTQAVKALEARLGAEFPGFSVAYKDESSLQQLIGALLRPINRTYLTEYTTVLFGVVWFPSRTWRTQVGPRAIYEILCHEAVHLRDARRYPGLFHLSYLLLPLPVVVTARAWWEWRAYRESLRVTLALDGEISDAQLRCIEDRFVGPDYGFMWPFRRHLRRRLERLRAALLREARTGGAPASMVSATSTLHSSSSGEWT